MADKKSNFGLGMIIGTIIGGVTAFFFSPNSGKENREMAKKKIDEIIKMLEEHQVPEKIKEIFGEVTEEGKKAFNMAKEEMDKKLGELKQSINEIDKDKYVSLVNDVVEKVKEETQDSAVRLNRLKNYLVDRWEKVQEEKKG